MEPLKRHRQDKGLHEHEETTIRFYQVGFGPSCSRTRTGTTKRSRPLSRQEGLQDLKEMDARSEESSLTAATSQRGQLTEMGTASCGDWQEVIYRKIKSMREIYYPKLYAMYHRMSGKLQKHDAHLKDLRMSNLKN